MEPTVLLLWVVLGEVLVLFVLPELWARLWLRRPVPPHGPDDRRVALTFDDGPDPQTTPLVLQTLAQFRAPATFFVLGQRAEAHPEVVQAIHEQGHAVAIHGWHHTFPWAHGCIQLAGEIRRCTSLLTSLLGASPRLYRPPWGMMTLLTLPAAQRAHVRLALYDVESGDWLRTGPEAIVRRVLKRVRPGSVVLLHDAAQRAEQVPRMLEALRQIIPALREQGYEFVTMSELMPPQPRRSLLLRAWIAWERLFARLTGALGMTESIHVLPYVYRGPTKVLDGQEVLRSGDRCLEIHFHNEMMYQLPGESAERLGGLLRHSIADMSKIAALLREDPSLAGVKAMTAITLFHRPSVRVGFHSDPVEPAWRRRFFTWYMLLIKHVYQGGATSHAGREARFIWMTRAEFIARFAPVDAPPQG